MKNMTVTFRCREYRRACCIRQRPAGWPSLYSPDQVCHSFFDSFFDRSDRILCCAYPIVWRIEYLYYISLFTHIQFRLRHITKRNGSYRSIIFGYENARIDLCRRIYHVFIDSYILAALRASGLARLFFALSRQCNELRKINTGAFLWSCNISSFQRRAVCSDDRLFIQDQDLQRCFPRAREQKKAYNQIKAPV